MNVLVDSSIWVGHFKQRNDRLVALLEAGAVISHPYVVAEVACGTPPSRRAIISIIAPSIMVWFKENKRLRTR